MQERRAIVYDNKIPLTWILTSSGTVFVLLVSVLWNVAIQNAKLDQLVIQAGKIEVRSYERDQKLETLIHDSYDSKRNVDVLNVRLQSLEKVRLR